MFMQGTQLWPVRGISNIRISIGWAMGRSYHGRYPVFKLQKYQKVTLNLTTRCIFGFRYSQNLNYNLANFPGFGSNPLSWYLFLLARYKVKTLPTFGANKNYQKKLNMIYLKMKLRFKQQFEINCFQLLDYKKNIQKIIMIWCVVGWLACLFFKLTILSLN